MHSRLARRKRRGVTDSLSRDTLTLGVAFDPRRVSLVELNARLDRRLAARMLSLMPMRIMEPPADLKRGEAIGEHPPLCPREVDVDQRAFLHE